MRRWMSALLVCALLLGALPQAALAQNKKALALADDARAAFKEQRYDEAAELLLQAYKLHPEPNFLWNAARAYELGGRYDDAVGFYLRYATLDLSDDDRAQAQDKLARISAQRDLFPTLRAAQDEAHLKTLREHPPQGDAPAPAPVQPVAVDDTDWFFWGGVSATGLGALMLGTVGVLQLASIDTVEQYHEAAQGGDQGRYDALRDTLNVRVSASQFLLVGGLILTVGGGALLAWDLWLSPDEEAGVWLAPVAAPGGAGVTLEGRW